MAVGLLVVSLFLVLTAYRMPLGNAVMPGPGVMPLAIGLCMGVTATALLFSVLKRPVKSGDIVHLGSRHILVALLGLVWVSLFFEGLGFSLCLGVFLLALSREFSRQDGHLGVCCRGGVRGVLVFRLPPGREHAAWPALKDRAMQTLQFLWDGFVVAAQPATLFYCFIGCCGGPSSACCRAWGRWPAWCCCCRSPSASIRPPASSC